MYVYLPLSFLFTEVGATGDPIRVASHRIGLGSLAVHRIECYVKTATERSH